MNSAWQQWLQSAGARVENDQVQDFGDPQGELDAARSGSVLADLSHLGVLDFTGPDSEAFLQAQLSCDVRSIGATSSSYGSYCTPKGRMLADFLLWRLSAAQPADMSTGFRMVLSRSIVAPVQKRLRMYVLRLKVQVTDASDSTVLLGVSGDAPVPALRSVLADAPQQTHDHELARFGEGGTAISLPGKRRFLIAAAVESAPKLWNGLAAALRRPVGTPCWEWLDIRSGFPLVTARTQEQFLPQMVNLELIGGVSFKKGCFPGQEIVARTQHLGKVKRRMFLAHVDETRSPPSPGDDVYSDDIPDQASGTVVNAQAAPGGGYDLLAVVHHSSRESSVVRLHSTDGPVLRFLNMPYTVT
jgi:tRNA-modifying protein YgfZ